MIRLRPIASMLSLTAVAIALSACGRDDRTAGQQLDSAIAKTEQAAQNAATEARQEGAEAKAAIEQSTDKAAAAVDKAADQVATTTSDAMITAAINAELAKDASLSALKIDVDTRDGKVMLSGSAPSTAAKERATTLAANVKGVNSVENRLEVRG